MHYKIRRPFSNFATEKWQNLIILSIIVFYSVWLSLAVVKGPFQLGFAGDYLAFWSAGKIADENGYSQIYDIENLRSVQLQELSKLGLLNNVSSYSPFPVAILSIFIPLFQFLSKIKFEPSYWIWTFSNLIVLVGYLVFFTKKTLHGSLEKSPEIKLLLLMLISYPVWANFSEGQVNIILVVCVGEFLRQAINKKPVLSGLWLGGLLLKPQLLILIIPILLLMRYWKAIWGFTISSSIFFMTSFILSGSTGMTAMLDLWTRFSAGIATNSPDKMINWRMVGTNINLLFDGSFGWAITGLGMVFTVVLVFLLIKEKPLFGTSAWTITMAAVFSATLAVTWHSHYHMAAVLIPFLIYSSQFKLLPVNIIFAWATATIVLILITLIITSLILFITKKNVADLGYFVAISGFFLNLSILFSARQFLHSIKNSRNALVDNQTG